MADTVIQAMYLNSAHLTAFCLFEELLGFAVLDLTKNPLRCHLVLLSRQDARNQIILFSKTELMKIKIAITLIYAIVTFQHKMMFQL